MNAVPISLLPIFALFGLFDFFRVSGLPLAGFGVLMSPLCMILTLVAVDVVAGRSPAECRLFRYSSHGRRHLFLSLAYLILIVFGFVVAALNGARPILTVMAEVSLLLVTLLIFSIVIRTTVNRASIDGLMYALRISLLILISLNVTASILGLRSAGLQQNYLNDLTNMFGISAINSLFPFTASSRTLGIQSGVLVIFGVFFLFNARNVTSFAIGILMVVLGLGVVLILGGRASIALLAAVFLYTAFFDLAKRMSGLIVTTWALLPALIAFGGLGYSIVSVLGGDVISRVSVYEGDFASFSNRDSIFSTIIIGFFTQSSPAVLLFGNGAFGQVSSGLSDIYSVFFTNSYANPYGAPAHNTLLQVLLDYGLVGAALFLYLCKSLLDRLVSLASINKHSSSMTRFEMLPVSVFLYIFGSSVLEVSLTYFSWGVFLIFAFLNIFAIEASRIESIEAKLVARSWRKVKPSTIIGSR